MNSITVKISFAWNRKIANKHPTPKAGSQTQHAILQENYLDKSHHLQKYKVEIRPWKKYKVEKVNKEGSIITKHKYIKPNKSVGRNLHLNEPSCASNENTVIPLNTFQNLGNFRFLMVVQWYIQGQLANAASAHGAPARLKRCPMVPILQNALGCTTKTAILRIKDLKSKMLNCILRSSMINKNIIWIVFPYIIWRKQVNLINKF